MDKKLIEQVKIVEHYMTNMDKYPIIKDDGYWGGLKATKLKGKDKKYIDKIEALINERIDIGSVVFRVKYKVT